MNYKKSLLFLCALLSVMTSCGDKEEIQEQTQEQNPDGNGETGGGESPSPETPDVPEAEELRFTFDLRATLSQEETAAPECEFPEQMEAVALLRSSDSELVYYLPLTMQRSAEEKGTLVAARQSVEFDGVKTDPQRKWQMRLLAGGTWNGETRRMDFTPESRYTASAALGTLALRQPYLSAWQEVPTDEHGQFIGSEQGVAVVTSTLTAPASIITHHIKTCDAPATVEINTLRFSTEAFLFGGSYDLSDVQHIGWTPQETPYLDVQLTDPIHAEVGVEPENDYIYLWAMPAEGEHRITVTASGQVTGEQPEAFSDLNIFEEELPTEPSRRIRVEATVHIEREQVVEGPITLTTASGKNTLTADGKEEVVFLVKQSGVDVTAQCTIYQQNGIFGDEAVTEKKFSTRRSGTYSFYAKKENERSETLRITAQEPEVVNPDGEIVTGTLFCPNVTAAKGWYDVNKEGNGNGPRDGLLCWAAASSNLLQWWLDDFVAKGHELPESVPHGPGKKYALAIFDLFYECWTNYMHSTEPAVRWFMKGGGLACSSENSAKPDKKGYVVDGGFFKGVLSPEKEVQLFNSEFIKEYGAYSNWDYPQTEEDRQLTRHQRFSRVILRLFKKGPTALSVDSHELTAWGCEVKDGLVVRIYVTNSDDGQHHLPSYKVEDRNGWMHLKDYPGKTSHPTEIIRLTGITGYEF